MAKATKYVLVKRFEGFPIQTDLELQEEELSPLRDGEFLAEAVYLSVDPYQRKYVNNFPLNGTMIGTQVARIVKSKNPNFSIGKYVTAQFGWRTHTISNGTPSPSGVPVLVVPDLTDLPLSLAIGMLGMPGNSAYFGLLDVLQPIPGEVLVVSGAAGAVGSHVSQIAKIKGLKVIGITGSDQKGKWLTDEVGLDHFINYKNQDVAAELQTIAPEGVDVYFDNVGGEVTTAVLKNMKTFGRISACGSISSYNDAVAKIEPIQSLLVTKQLKLQGFQNLAYRNRWNESFQQNLKWIKQGKLKYKETVTEGFANMFEAFTDMLKGGNIGKAIVKV